MEISVTSKTKEPKSFVASDVVGLRSQRSHANYCNPCNLEQYFTLILLISARNIKREIKSLC